jgi:hypothetical protein
MVYNNLTAEKTGSGFQGRKWRYDVDKVLYKPKEERDDLSRMTSK